MLARPVDQLSVVFAKLMTKGIVQMPEHLGGYTLRLQIPKGSTVVNDQYAGAMRETPIGIVARPQQKEESHHVPAQSRD